MSALSMGSSSSSVSASLGTSSYLDSNQLFGAAVKQINQPAASTDNPLILLRNPAGSGKSLYLVNVTWSNTVTNVLTDFSIFFSPTVTANGTSLGVFSRSFAGTPVALATTTPTISANGNRVVVYGTGQNTAPPNVIEPYSIKIPAGSAILITGDPSSNNRPADIFLSWAEF